MTTGEKLLTRPEVAAQFGVALATVSNWARTGQLPVVRRRGGARGRYPLAAVEALVAAHRDPAFARPPAPKASLLPAGHRWAVIVSPGWRLVVKPRRCVYNVGLDAFAACGQPSVAISAPAPGGKSGSGRCALHLDSIRWIEDGQVWQWRAVPGGGGA